MPKIQAKKLTIHHILGVDHVEIELGKITEITGANGVGKTSVLEAIKALGTKGTDVTLLRKGETEGRVMLELSDGSVIERREKVGKSDRRYKPASGPAMGATAVDQLFELASMNPVSFIVSEPKQRMQMLLDSLNIEVTDEEMTAARGEACTGGGLDHIDSVRDSVFKQRTGVNRAILEKKSTVSQLSENIPPPTSGTPTEALAAANAELAEKSRKRDAFRDGIIAEAAEKERVAREAYEAERVRIEEEKRKRLDDLEKSYIEKTSELNATIGRLTEAINASAAYEAQTKVINQVTKEVELLEQEKADLTAALERIDALKASKLGNLPFKDLTIQDGEIFVGGVAYDRLNTAAKVRFAIQLAVARAGKVGLVCVDGLELLDETTYGRFVEAASNQDKVQFVVTRVTEGPLKIEPKP